MTEKSYPWDGVITGDAADYGPVDSDEWSEIWGILFGSGYSGSANRGVIDGYLNELAVTGAATPVSVDTGAALVDGTLYRNETSAITLAVSTPSGATRTDRVVLRKSWSAQTVRAAVSENGSEGTGTPPALTQTEDTTWEIPIATLSVTTGGVISVTDAREFVHIGASRARKIVVQACGGYNDNDVQGLIHQDWRGIAFDDGEDAYAYGHFAWPADYLSGLTVKALISTASGITGDFYGSLKARYGACSEAYDTHEETTGPEAATIDAAETLTCILSLTITEALAGDIVSLQLFRDGDNVGDTLSSGDVYCRGFLVEYTADS